jgi:hypothetical protein
MTDRNPSRGCGSKVPDSYYLEGDDIALDGSGMFWAWTWFLGDGIEDFILVSKSQLPPRSTMVANPAATIIEKTLVRGDYPYEPDIKNRWKYTEITTATMRIGSADHVGTNNYTPWSFAKETNKLGASRKITKEMAKVFAEIFQEHGPYPMLFSHSHIPVFESIEQRDEMISLSSESLAYSLDMQALADEFPIEERWLGPTWERPSWGQYSFKNQEPGFQHFMVPILIAMHDMKRNHTDEKHWSKVRKAYSKLRFTEQIYGASFMTKVTYTLPEEGKTIAAQEAEHEVPGVELLDLDAYEEEKRMANESK